MVAQTAKEAARSFQEGRYEDALEIYRHLALENPKDARFTYNAGVAAYKAGQFGEAMELFDSASLAPDLNVQQQAHYNMGNALYRAGESATEFEQKAAAWKQAVQRYEHALTIDETDSLAEENLGFVKQRLEELEQQQEEQQDQNQDQDQNQEENEDESEQDQNSESDQQENEDQSDQSDSQEQEQDPSDSSQSEQNDEQGQQEQDNQQQSGEENQEQQPEQNSEESSNPESGDPSQQQVPQEGKMTPEQARQLLDAERDQAQAMIFRPPQERKPKNRTFKDW